MALSSLASGTLSFPSGYGVSILLTLSAVAFGKAVSPESLPLWLTELRGRNPLSGGIALFLAAVSALAAAHYDGHVFVPLKNAGHGLLFMSGVLTAAGDFVATWDRLKARKPALEGGAS